MSKKKTIGDVNREENSELVTLAAPADAETQQVETSANKEAVVVKPPADKEMEEVSAEEFAGRHIHTMGQPVPALSSVIQNLIGLPLPEVRAKLEDLKTQRRIRDFKVIPLGTPLTTQAVPGMVQVIKDHSDNVLDIVLG